MTRAGYDISLTRLKNRQERILLLAYFQPRSVPSIVENIALLQKLSCFPVSVLNLADHRPDSGHLKIPPSIDLSSFDAVIIHNTVGYNPDNLRSLDQLLDVRLDQYEGVKIVLKQDEHYRFGEFAQFAKHAAIDTIFSIMPESEVAKTYGRLLPSVNIRHMLTSYVTATMREPLDLLGLRPIDIGYRGSIMPLSFGRLCYQKRKIGDDVSRLLEGKALSLDISSRWEDRIGGDAWHTFLASCKAVLGVESGSDLVDMDGTLAAKCADIEARLGPDDSSDVYAERFLAELAVLEGEISYRTIAPRHFEAIAAGAVQILFPGTYTGRMVAGKHYVELDHDYQNLQEAVEFIRDPVSRNAMATRAFEEVILDRRNWIETFVQKLDEALLETLEVKGKLRRPQAVGRSPARNVVVVQAHEYGQDPRRDSWYALGAPNGVTVHHIGIRDKSNEEILRPGPCDEVIWNVPRRPWTPGCLDAFVAQAGCDAGASHALRELYFIAHTTTLNDADLLSIYGMSQSATVAAGFRGYLEYVLNTSVSLLHALNRVNGVHALVAINFPSLIPSIIAKALLNVPLIYEALEYWPEADPNQHEFARIFWLQFEARLARYADFRGTVSPPLALLMSEQFGVPFYCVPNCAPLSSRIAAPPLPETTVVAPDRVRFLFQGNFAPYRGLEQLVQAWNKVDPRAVLLLRGPDNAFKESIVELSRSLGLGEDRVQFPAAVDITELIRSAQRDGEVGIIPYTPTGANYSNCSPNKLSQYMAAGLPILANATNFVFEVVRNSGAGVVVDFQREASLVNAIGHLCDENVRKECSLRAISYFEETFNWDVASKPFYAAIEESVGRTEPALFQVYDEKKISFYAHQQQMSAVQTSLSEEQNAVLLVCGELKAALQAALKISEEQKAVLKKQEEQVAAAVTSANPKIKATADMSYAVGRTVWRILPHDFRVRLAQRIFGRRID